MALNNLNYEREPAKRVFAAELREASKTIKDEHDEKSPVYLLLPTGEKCNRILISGTITYKDKIGEQNVIHRARVSDITGIFYISASSYQKNAMEQLSDIDTENPSYVVVVGKPNAYTTPDGKTLISVRAESIRVVDQQTRNLWIQDAARATLDRADALEKGELPDAKLAAEVYTFTPEHWRKMAYNALSSIL
ncbi:MAG TPA: nucleic acid-binding protein [Methanocorpusculum sp.]|nr:nucleic acid-binding protein [Methanocorpusculum sp.]